MYMKCHDARTSYLRVVLYTSVTLLRTPVRTPEIYGGVYLSKMLWPGGLG